MIKAATLLESLLLKPSQKLTDTRQEWLHAEHYFSQKENVKYTFLICRVEVYPKVHEAVNKTNCYIVGSVRVTLSDLLCSFFSCLCWCNLKGKETKNTKIL